MNGCDRPGIWMPNTLAGCFYYQKLLLLFDFIMNFKEYILSFRVHTAPVPFTEKICNGLICGIAILLLGFTIKLLPEIHYPLAVLSSIAASTVLLFVVPHSPMAQPWPLFGGHCISALSGWLCSQAINDPLLAAGCAVGMAIFLMHSLNCLHPPGAATALILVLYSAYFLPMGWWWIAGTILANVGVIFLLALIMNNLLPGRHYPLRHIFHPSQPVLQTDMQPKPLRLERVDIEWALTRMDGMIDVVEEDLIDIYDLAIKHAQGRNDKTNGNPLA